MEEQRRKRHEREARALGLSPQGTVANPCCTSPDQSTSGSVSAKLNHNLSRKVATECSACWLWPACSPIMVGGWLVIPERFVGRTTLRLAVFGIGFPIHRYARRVQPGHCIAFAGLTRPWERSFRVHPIGNAAIAKTGNDCRLRK